MSIILPNVRYHTSDSPYHYTEDNKPLEDLALRDQTLQTAIEAVSDSNFSTLAVGNWTNLQASLDLSSVIGLPFALRVRLWAIQDQSVSATQNATLSEDILTGYVSAGGTTNILSTFNNYKRQQGASILTYTYVPSGTSLNITFSGYVGTNAYIIVRAERFGP